MADTDIKLSVDLDIASAEQTAQSLQKEIEGIFKNRKSEQSASLTQLELQMKQSVQKAQALKQELNRISQQKIPTEEYKEVSKRLEKLNAQFDKLLIKQDTMQELGQTSGPAWEKLNIQMEQLGTLIREDTAELQQLVDTGKAFTLGSQTEAFKNTQASLDAVNDKMKQQIVRHREVEDAEEQKAQKTEEANNRVQKSNSKVTHSYRRAGSSATHMAKQIDSAFTRRLLPSMRSVRNAVSRMNHSLTKGLQPATKSVKRLAMRFLMLSLGARSMFALLRKVRTAIVKSFEDLQKSGVSPITEQIKELKATLNQVKNSFVAAFEPIIAMILPYLQRMAEALGNVIDKLAQFIAVLSGKNKYIRAIKQVGDAVEESGDKADGSLASFDKLNNITLGKKSTEYEEVEVEESVASAAITVKEKLDEIYNNFKTFKENLKLIIDKIKIGDWLGAAADLGSLVDTLLTKLTTKIEKFVPTSEQAEKLGAAIGTFLKNAHLENHISDALRILRNLIKSLFTMAFTAIQQFTPQELYNIGVGIADNIIAIFQMIIDILNEVPVKELASLAQGLLSKGMEIVQKIMETLKTLFVKAFQLLWTTVTGQELSEGATEALGEVANIALIAIGIEKVVRWITGHGVFEGLLGAFRKKDRALDRQQPKLANEASAVSTVWEKMKDWVSVLGPVALGIGLVTTAVELFTGESEVSEQPVTTLSEVTGLVGDAASTSSDSVKTLANKIRDLAGIGQNSYQLSGITAITSVIQGIGTSAYNSRQEIEKLQKALIEYGATEASEGLAGNTQVMKGTSGVTYNPKTGESYSPTHYTSPSKAINTGTVLAPADNSLIPLFPDLTGWQIDSLLKAFDGDVNSAKEAYDGMKALDTGTQAKILENLSMYQGSHDKERIVEIAKALKLQDITAGTTYISTADAEKLGALKDIAKGTEYMTGISMLFDLLTKFFKGVPAFARGAVIPAGKPFLAMLGDQKSGTNVEAPLDTIKQALSEVLADANMNATFQIVGDPHGMFKVIQKEATNYTKATGRLAF